MKYISWRELTHMKASEAAAYLRGGANVTVDGSVEMVLQNVDVAKGGMPVASRVPQTTLSQNVDRASVASAVGASEKGLEASQNVDRADLSKIPGLSRGMPNPASSNGRTTGLGPVDAGSSPAAGTIKPGSLEMYRPGYHKTGDRVLMWKNRQLVEAVVPSLDGDGQIIPGE